MRSSVQSWSLQSKCSLQAGARSASARARHRSVGYTPIAQSSRVRLALSGMCVKDTPAAHRHQIEHKDTRMWRRFVHGWLPCVLALSISFSVYRSPVLAGDHGPSNSYQGVQGYILQNQPQTIAPAAFLTQTPPTVSKMASAQSESNALTLAPPAAQPTTPTASLQLAPQPPQAPTLQLSPAPAQVQTLQLVPAPAQVQTLQLSPAPCKSRPCNSAPRRRRSRPCNSPPRRSRCKPCNSAPRRRRSRPCNSAPRRQVATPVLLLVPKQHKCHWFCRCKCK